MKRPDDDREYSTGQAARMTHVSQAKVRRWCNDGLIDCSQTNGGHFRITASAIEHIQKHGEPELPRRSTNVRESARPRNRGALDGLPPDLYGEPSDRLVSAVEDVKLAENRVRRRKFELEGELVEDEFRERNQRRAAEEREHQRELAEAERKEDRQRWIQAKLDWTFKPRPSEPGWENFDIVCQLSGIPQRSGAGLPMNAPTEVKAKIATNVLKLIQTDAAGVTPEALLDEQIEAVVASVLAEQHRIEQEKQNATFRALVEIVAHRNARDAQQTARNLEAIAHAAKLVNVSQPAVTAEPIQTTRSTVPRPVEPPDEDKHNATEEADQAAMERRVADLLMSEVAIYLRECEADGDIEFENVLDRWSVEQKFRDAIRPHILDTVETDPEITDGDLRIEIRNRVDEFWDDIFDEE
jgi:hypothetical protein